MNKFVLAIVVLLTTHPAFAQDGKTNISKDTLNWSFEQSAKGRKTPDNWHLMSPNAKKYDVSLDSTIRRSGLHSLLISSIDTAISPQYAGVGYLLPARYSGNEVTVKGWMKTENMKGSLALMLGVYDADGNTLQFENLQDKRIKGSKEWKQYSVILPLSAEAQKIHIGPILIGKGKLWIDDIEVFIDGVPVQEAKLKPNFNPNPPLNPNYGDVAGAGGYIKLKDANLYYEVYGSGEPLLLLHGNSGSIHAFYKQIPELSKNFKVIAVDSRGQGKSTDESIGPLTYDGFADDMKQLLDSLHITKANILGWSDGGNTGLIMAIKYPSYVNKLAVTGAVLAPTTDAVDASTLKEVRKQRDNIKGITQPDLKSKRLMTLLLDEPSIPVSDLKQIKAPALVMAGEKDMIKEKHTRTIAGNIPDSKLVIFNDATHYVPVEKYKEFNAAVIAFFK
jgi:pimeloyl-ACP methyl ester carboxylesterase